VFLLISSGPASAVTISVNTDKNTYIPADRTVVFTVQVDIESNERIPVQNLTLRITGPNSFSKNCTFTTSGSNLTRCENLVITPISIGNYGQGNMFGYGFGYNSTSGQWVIENQTFGYGYGYEYESGSIELRYNISWNISAETISSGSFSANLEVFAQSGSNVRIYKSQTSKTFTFTNEAIGTYTNNMASTIANITTTVNATTTANTIIRLDMITTSNITNASIIITEYNSTPPNATTSTTVTGVSALNKFIEIDVSSELNSSLSWFMVYLYYTDSEISAAGLDESSLKLYQYNNSSNAWTPLSNTGVNTVSNYVWGNLSHLSLFGIFGSAPITPAAVGGIYVGGGCTYNWTCTKWSSCINGIQTRVCTNLGSCKDLKGKPLEHQTCEVTTPPLPTEKPTEPSTPEVTPVAPSVTTFPTTPLGMGIGLLAVIIVSLIVIIIILKKRKLGKKVLRT
jgi:hypothetical protein